jgi:hypothetical protein
LKRSKKLGICKSWKKAFESLRLWQGTIECSCTGIEPARQHLIIAHNASFLISPGSAIS